MVSENEDDARAKVAKLIALLPSNNAEGVCIEEITDDVNRVLSAEAVGGRALVEEIADRADLFEIGAEYAPEMLTALIKLGGVTCGVVANEPSVKDGCITVEAAKKAAKWISLCDSLSIPVITLVNSAGVETGKDAENAPLAAQLGKLAMAYATADTATVTAVVGKAYGAAFTLMGSKSLGVDMVYALPNAEISVMAPESAVAFLWNDRITEETSRADLVTEWKETQAHAEKAAADGSIDDIVARTELRQRLCSAVYMLLMKNDGIPARKHCNLPL